MSAFEDRPPFFGHWCGMSSLAPKVTGARDTGRFHLQRRCITHRCHQAISEPYELYESVRAASQLAMLELLTMSHICVERGERGEKGIR